MDVTSRTLRSIYEINTWVWLSDLSRIANTAINLGSVPAAEWDSIAQYGFDAVWLMGVWERSPAGIAIANRNSNLLNEFRRTLPDFALEDNIGSAYCIRRYAVAAHLGGPEGLSVARNELARRGIKLMLDFVGNHVAPDCPWITEHPEYFIAGSEQDLRDDPGSYLQLEGRILAAGRDPNFPAWPDVVQLNAFHPGLRTAMVQTLLDIAAQCDGVRCDMAVLLLNEVFARTWRGRAGQAPATDYWLEIIPPVCKAHPGFIFLAEAYWNLEVKLQEQGFCFCYDKLLYDDFHRDDVAALRGQLSGGTAYQRKLVRFIENHDELRSATAFSPVKVRAGATAIATLPGAALFHEGQFEGRRVKVPVFLRRRPEEPVDLPLRMFYAGLLRAVNHPIFHRGEWTVCRTTGWPDNQSCQNLLAWQWVMGDERRLVVINLSGGDAEGRVHVQWIELGAGTWLLVDVLSGVSFSRDGEELASAGLYVQLNPYNLYFFEVHSAVKLNQSAESLSSQSTGRIAEQR
jgi:hypothetical protein